MDDDPRDPRPEDLPTSLIPRWLAALVLLALVASGIWTTWIVLSH